MKKFKSVIAQSTTDWAKGFEAILDVSQCVGGNIASDCKNNIVTASPLNRKQRSSFRLQQEKLNSYWVKVGNHVRKAISEI